MEVTPSHRPVRLRKLRALCNDTNNIRHPTRSPRETAILIHLVQRCLNTLNSSNRRHRSSICLKHRPLGPLLADTHISISAHNQTIQLLHLHLLIVSTRSIPASHILFTAVLWRRRIRRPISTGSSRSLRPHWARPRPGLDNLPLHQALHNHKARINRDCPPHTLPKPHLHHHLHQFACQVPPTAPTNEDHYHIVNATEVLASVQRPEYRVCRAALVGRQNPKCDHTQASPTWWNLNANALRHPPRENLPIET